MRRFPHGVSMAWIVHSHLPMNEQPGPSDDISPAMHPKRRWVAVMTLMSLAVILAFFFLPRLSSRSPGARALAAKAQIASLGSGFGAFKIDNGYYPPGTNGLLCLTQRPIGATNWRGPYMERPVQKDPWGRDYIYECPGRQNPRSYDLSSMGPDGRVGGGDDICNWKPN
jgi:general secretion pathway protein G